jgi:CheY-like chemotaxis protein
MSRELILVVEDNPANRLLMTIVLSHAGYDVRTAIDAEQVVEALRSFQPKLILMDIQLPGTDGLELTRQLKSSPTTRHIPIVAVSAYAMKGDDVKGLGAGCDGYITKPIDTRTLPRLVADYFK